MEQRNNIRVAICISTFRRQKLLRELLNGIGKLSFRKVSPPELAIVVVDTPDQTGSVQKVCETVSLPWPIKYVVEPRRGLTYARNRAIAEAGSVDFVAFIDDDEVPSPEWLDELLWAQAEFSADVVSGPVSPHYGPGVAGWIKAGGFFSSRPQSHRYPMQNLRYAQWAGRNSCVQESAEVRRQLCIIWGRGHGLFSPCLTSGLQDSVVAGGRCL